MLLGEINVLERITCVSPSVVGFEVSVLFQARQQDCGAFYETDLFLCGLWLSRHSCSITNEEWRQAKGCLHGCWSQEVNRHSRAAENICVHTTGHPAWVPNLLYRASLASHRDAFYSCGVLGVENWCGWTDFTAYIHIFQLTLYINMVWK